MALSIAKPESTMHALRSTIMVAVMQAVLFHALAAVCLVRVPVRATFGTDSTLGIRPLREQLGGVDHVDLSLSIAWIDDVLGMDEMMKQSWMDSTAPRVRADPEAASPVEAGLPERPEVWPIDGQVTWAAKPALALLATRGVTLTTREFEVQNVVSLKPLTLRLGREPVVFALVALATLVTSLVVRRRGGLGRRLVAGFMDGLTGGVLCVVSAGALARFGLPTLHPEWQRHVDELIRLGRIQPFDWATADNALTVAVAVGAFVVASLLAAVSRRTSTAP